MAPLLEIKGLKTHFSTDDGILQAVTAQKPFEMGHTAVETAAKVLGGEPVERGIVLPGILFSRDKPEEIRAYQKNLAEASH